jgi:hypothetical protein
MIEQSSRKLLAGAFALLLLIPLVTSSGFAAGSPAAAGIMVPLYTYPGGTWDAVISTKNAHPDLPIAAIVNPASGPGSSKDSNYASGIAELKDAGVMVLGYVSTAYTGRDLNAVKSDMDKWRSWYPDVQGIFFDEQTNWAGPEWYYDQADDYAKSKGFTFTVGNPGANSLPSYLDTVDVVLIYESPGLPNLGNYQSWSSADNGKLGMIPFGVGSMPRQWITDASQLVGWIYVTHDVLPNPWDSLPPYFGDMAALLDDGSSSSPPPAPAPTMPRHTLTVKSVDQNGNAINGMWMEVKKAGATVSTGFTPLTLTLERATYTVSAGNYQQIIFDHWSDGSRSATASVSLSGNAAITAHYNNGAVKPLSVSLSADKTAVAAGSPVSFSASIGGGASPYTWSVNFGDGTSSPYGTSSSVSKTYSAPGTYSTVATAKDSAGKTASSNAVAVTVNAQPTASALTVKTVDSAGKAISGYYTTLSGGGQTQSGFSPASFTLNGGQTYQVSVSDYGDYVFSHWEGGSTSRTQSVAAANGQAISMTAHYASASSTKEATLTVRSADLDGKAVDGLWTVVKQDGATVKSGYTPLAYTAQAGASLEVTVSNYQNYAFDHWDSGSKSSTRQVTVSTDATITAHYSTGSDSQEQVSLTIRSAGLDGSPISGLWTVISSGGSTLKSGFTSLTYDATAGTQYTVTVSDYKNYVFDHWEDGSKNRSRTVTPDGSTSITAHYRQ